LARSDSVTLSTVRLPRATFSLMLALLPVFATVIGAIVLRQLPGAQDIVGVALVVVGVAAHQGGSMRAKANVTPAARCPGCGDAAGEGVSPEDGRAQPPGSSAPGW
jgi:inner membrane transporter RhtA